MKIHQGILATAAVVVLSIVAAACDTHRVPQVAFVVELSNPLPVGDHVYLAGNLDTLGLWHPDGLRLRPVSERAWVGNVAIPPGALEFKITRGTWETEAVEADGRIPENHLAFVRGDTTITVLVEAWKDLVASPFRSFSGQITGDVRYHREMEGEGIRARDVLVWLPPSYGTDPSRRYPVLYMQDGQNAIDPATSFNGVDWQVDERVDSLSRAGRMKEILIVAVYGSADRSVEYDDTESGEAYLRWMVHELKPFIDSTYRTEADRKHTAIMGASRGGTISFLALWKHSDAFSMAASLSPLFPEELRQRVALSGWNAGDARLYVDCGGDSLDQVLKIGVEPMLATLANLGFEQGSNLSWYLDETATHDEAAWSRRVWRPLLFFFGLDQTSVDAAIERSS